MLWIKLLLAFLAAFTVALAASFLSLAWKKRRKTPERVLRIEASLPGHDCGLCSYESCHEYAVAIDSMKADPALCAPGGHPTETALRSILAPDRNTRPDYGSGAQKKNAIDVRSQKMRAIVRCGGSKRVARPAFEYDSWGDCASAASLYGGPLLCKDGCIGFGSCANACPLGAIKMKDGAAVVDSRLCSGCGACLPACPKDLIALVSAEETCFVACSSRMEKGERRAVCSAACDACGECARRSMRGEFSILASLARAAAVPGGAWEDIVPSCPTGAIHFIEAKKRDDPPFGRSDAKL